MGGEGKDVLKYYFVQFPFQKTKIALIECYLCATYYITLTSLYATELVLYYFGNILHFTK